jgi:hypothetical protein
MKAGGALADGSAGAIRKGSDAAVSIGASNPRVFATAQANIAELMDRQPLVLGATGPSVGAAMAAAAASSAPDLPPGM